jgi:hypothetical protein
MGRRFPTRIIARLQSLGRALSTTESESAGWSVRGRQREGNEHTGRGLPTINERMNEKKNCDTDCTAIYGNAQGKDWYVRGINRPASSTASQFRNS